MIYYFDKLIKTDRDSTTGYTFIPWFPCFKVVKVHQFAICCTAAAFSFNLCLSVAGLSLLFGVSLQTLNMTLREAICAMKLSRFWG